MIMDENAAQYIIQYPLAMIFIAIVAAVAIFIGITLRKNKNKKEEAAAVVSQTTEEAASQEDNK